MSTLIRAFSNSSGQLDFKPMHLLLKLLISRVACVAPVPNEIVEATRPNPRNERPPFAELWSGYEDSVASATEPWARRNEQ